MLPHAVVCYLDSTVALPLLTAYVLENVPPRPCKRLYDRRDEMLESLRDAHLKAQVDRQQAALQQKMQETQAKLQEAQAHLKERLRDGQQVLGEKVREVQGTLQSEFTKLGSQLSDTAQKLIKKPDSESEPERPE